MLALIFIHFAMMFIITGLGLLTFSGNSSGELISGKNNQEVIGRLPEHHMTWTRLMHWY